MVSDQRNCFVLHPMKLAFINKYLYHLLRVALGGLFVYAGILKLFDTASFAQTIDDYGLVTLSVARFLSYTLPIGEIVTGLGLILHIKGALALIAAQLLLFMGVIGYAMHIGLDVDCGCFGSIDSDHSEPASLSETLIRDMLMFAACLFLYWQRKVLGLSPKWPHRLLKSRRNSNV